MEQWASVGDLKTQLIHRPAFHFGLRLGSHHCSLAPGMLGNGNSEVRARKVSSWTITVPASRRWGPPPNWLVNMQVRLNTTRRENQNENQRRVQDKEASEVSREPVRNHFFLSWLWCPNSTISTAKLGTGRIKKALVYQSRLCTFVEQGFLKVASRWLRSVMQGVILEPTCKAA